MKRITFDESWPESWKDSYVFDLEEIYGETVHRGYTKSYENRRDQTVRLLKGAVAPGARVLDIAAGQGNFSILLAEMGYEVTWNDLRTDLVDYVRLKQGKGKINFAPGNAFELEFPSPFDAVLITEIIEHVAHPDEFLKKTADLVKPGGYIIMTTPNGAYFPNDLPRFTDCPDPSIYETGQFKPDADGHIFLLHIDEVRSLAKQANLEVEELILFNNPLSNGHMKTEPLLRILPDGLVNMIEVASQRIPSALSQHFFIHVGARFRKSGLK